MKEIIKDLWQIKKYCADKEGCKNCACYIKEQCFISDVNSFISPQNWDIYLLEENLTYGKVRKNG